MQIILSTRNPSKAEQIKAMFNNPSFEVITLSEAGIEGEAVEDGTTLQENALKKALYAFENAHHDTWAMADDTGLFINALDGQPGIKAARWAGESATTDEMTQFTLDQLRDKEDRTGFFETAVALISPEGEHHFFSGKVGGHFLTSPRTKPQPKMPYSPLFVPEGTNLVWAEMSIEQENAISHRGKAFGQVVAFLEDMIKN